MQYLNIVFISEQFTEQFQGCCADGKLIKPLLQCNSIEKLTGSNETTFSHYIVANAFREAENSKDVSNNRNKHCRQISLDWKIST